MKTFIHDKFMTILFDDDFVDTDLQFWISSFEDGPIFFEINFALHRCKNQIVEDKPIAC